mmetsp:Transcript_22271/g.68546  ORF Transcript_22271/g.68546 Transcript_22271/m.68546 type:complete len:128 (-) Transcript_22271:162-545(-)
MHRRSRTLDTVLPLQWSDTRPLRRSSSCLGLVTMLRGRASSAEDRLVTRRRFFRWCAVLALAATLSVGSSRPASRAPGARRLETVPEATETAPLEPSLSKSRRRRGERNRIAAERRRRKRDAPSTRE